MSTESTIGARIREIRKDRKLNVPQLAKAIGLSAQVVYRWEWGRRDPSVSQLEKIAAALACTPADLISKEPFKRTNSSSRPAA